jgi:hypothetical protein
MDANWYAVEKIVDEMFRAQRAQARVAHLAAIARRHRMRRRIGIMLIKLGRTLVAEPGTPIAQETALRGTTR